MPSYKEIEKLYKEVKNSYKLGTIDSPECLQQYIWLKNLVIKASLSQNDKLYWSSRVLIFEIEDYLGIKWHNEEWEREFRSLAQNPETMGSANSAEEISLLKSKVRCAIAGINLIYRVRKYEQALNESQKLERFIKENLHNWKKQQLSHGLLGMLKYTQGKIFRKLNSYDAAIQCFNDSILAYHNRAEFKSKELSDENEIKAEQSFSLVRMAWSLGFGLGFIHFTRGDDISRAQFMVITALTILSRHGYVIHQNSLKILKASIRRAAIASSKDLSEKERRELIRLEIDVKECLDAFKQFDENGEVRRHQNNQLRGLYELSVIRYYLATASKDPETESNLLIETLNKLTDLAGDDAHWKAQALILQSHFFCHQNKLNEALASAEKSIELSSEITSINCEALLVKAKVLLLMQKYQEARKLLKDILQRGNNNPRIEIMTQLRLVECVLREKEYSQALKIWEQIRFRQNEFQYAYIKEAFIDLNIEIDELGNALVFFDADQELDAKTHFNKLKGWLYKQAEIRAGGVKTEMKKLLGGIDEDTFKTWKKWS